MLDIFLLRDDFESLKCCLDLWLSSMLDCINIYVFLFFEKLYYYFFFNISTASQYLSTARLSIEPLDLPFSIAVIAISIDQSFQEFVLIAP